MFAWVTILFGLKNPGAEDPRCPLAGLEIPKARARKAYAEANCSDNFKVWTCVIW